MSSNSHYTLPPQPPATAWARHIDAIRRERDLSQTAAYRLLREAVGLLGDSRSGFRPYLVDKEPDADQAKALAAIIGWPPVETQPVATVSEPAPDLAAALMELAGELKAAREERARYLAMEGTVKALEETVAGLLRSSRKAGGSGASRAGRAPQGSAE